jgi:hypothetical protein
MALHLHDTFGRSGGNVDMLLVPYLYVCVTALHNTYIYTILKCT